MEKSRKARQAFCSFCSESTPSYSHCKVSIRVLFIISSTVLSSLHLDFPNASRLCIIDEAMKRYIIADVLYIMVIFLPMTMLTKVSMALYLCYWGYDSVYFTVCPQLCCMGIFIDAQNDPFVLRVKVLSGL